MLLADGTPGAAGASDPGARSRPEPLDGFLALVVLTTGRIGVLRDAIEDHSQPGDWEPWIAYVALGWGLAVAIIALKTYFGRPTSEAEIERELERMRSRRVRRQVPGLSVLPAWRESPSKTPV